MSPRENFSNDGYLIVPGFVKNENFFQLSDELNQKIQSKINNMDLKKIGGYKIGNLNLNAGKYASKIWDLLLEQDIEKLIVNLLEKPLSDFTIKISGNICLPNKGEQHFHTDGQYESKMYLISVATQDVMESSGPTEVVLNCNNKIPYWKFLMKNKKKKKIVLSKGDLIIRKHSTWHRGTKNLSDKPRFLIAFLLFDKNSKIKSNYDSISKFNETSEIIIFNNFFPSSTLGRFKESIYVKFKPIFIFYKLLRSIFE
tara:strand:+ start:1037 stop:1804 length:768 start_codon:yes stop_codon:yes gene_type:complete